MRSQIPRHALLSVLGASLAAAGLPGPRPALAAPPPPEEAPEPFTPRTRLELREGRWHLNGQVTHPGSAAEGLLLNVRMANATFEDRNPRTCPKGFDPDRNTERFVAALPDYVRHGVDAFTLSLQGAHPGYDGALSSACEPDGSLRPAALRRLARAVEACDRAGAGVLLTLFDEHQDQVLQDPAAVRRAVAFTAEWIRSRGYTNVAVEIARAFPSKGYDHALIRNPLELPSLLRLAREKAPGLLVSASGEDGGRIPFPVAIESDFVLLHFSAIDPDTVYLRVATMSKVSKPLVCNEDAKTGKRGAEALEAAVFSLCSWGYVNREKNEHYPFEFQGSADDPLVYAKFRELSRPE